MYGEWADEQKSIPGTSLLDERDLLPEAPCKSPAASTALARQSARCRMNTGAAVSNRGPQSVSPSMTSPKCQVQNEQNGHAGLKSRRRSNDMPQIRSVYVHQITSHHALLHPG